MRKSFTKDGIHYTHIGVVAKRSGYTEGYIRTLCSTKQMQGIKAGGAWYIEESELPRSINRLQQQNSVREGTQALIRAKELVAIVGLTRLAKRAVGAEIRLRRT